MEARAANEARAQSRRERGILLGSGFVGGEGLLGVGIAAAVGALLALPVIRLAGVWLTLATLAFALFFDSVLVKFSWVNGQSLQEPFVPRPVIGPIDFVLLEFPDQKPTGETAAALLDLVSHFNK